MNEDDESDIIDDLYLSEVNYRSLSDVNYDSSLCKVNSDSLMTEVSNSFKIDIVKEKPMTVTTVSISVRSNRSSTCLKKMGWKRRKIYERR